MKLTLASNGYYRFTKDGRNWSHHRYVWTQANGEIPKGKHIHHINGIKTDNRLENLKLVTHKENHRQSDRWGKMWVHYPNKTSIRKYKSKRFGEYLGYFGTPCGAYMKAMMYFVKQSLKTT